MKTHLCVLSYIALACIAVGCKETSANYCCLSDETCNGGPITPCDDPSRPFCDEAGEFGPRQGCVPDPISSDCEGPEDCTTAERPFCIDGRCVQCEDSGDCAATEPVCAGDTFLCGPCAGDVDCEDRAATPRCLESSGACVACLDADDCTNPTPVCDTGTNECRACDAHSECASEVCDASSGACLAEADVIYLAPGGVAGTCTRAAPCGTFAQALGQVTGTRKTIKASAGEYQGLLQINGTTVSILADGAVAKPPAGNLGQTIVTVTGGADVSIEGLIVTGVLSAANTVAFTCNGSTLRLRRSRIIANTGGGGLSLTDCEFSLVNNIIAANGGTSSTFGGVSISQISTGTLHQFEFNTVTANTGIAGANTGVDCTNIFVPISLRNSIVYNNSVGAGGEQVGGDSDCAWSYSDIGPQSESGTGNINMDPMFVDPINRDFHLQPGSPARDAADPAATTGIDIDGESRPAGNAPDMGADEVQ